MGAFGSISLANKFGIILGSAIVFTFAAGITKVWINRRRLRKATKYAEIEAARNHTEKAVQKELREGDLFGVRAIEHGFYGGVSQSRPSTPVPLSKATTPNQTSSPISPIRSMTPSGSKTLPAISKQMKDKPTPLQLRPQETVYKKSSPGREPAPIQLSPLRVKSNVSVRSTSTSGSGSSSGWISPLDVHFNRVQTPTSPVRERPRSFIPRLQFPKGELKEERGKNARLVVMPTRPGLEESAVDLKSEAASFHSGIDMAIPEQARSKASPTFSLFPNNRPSHAQRPSHGNLMLDAIPPPPVPEKDGYLPEFEDSQKPSRDQGQVYQPQRYRSQSPDAMPEGREHSTSTHGAKSSNPRNRSRSSSSPNKLAKHRRSASSHAINRTQDSVRRSRHSRKYSPGRENRRSRDRDQLHYDPHNNYRNRSGSIQGRSIDFDNPRVNPFADGHAIPSVRSDSAVTQQDIDSALAERVSQMKPRPGESSRSRSGTDESQGSMGDFFDSYYSRSNVEQRDYNVSKTATNGKFAPGKQATTVENPQSGLEFI